MTLDYPNWILALAMGAGTTVRIGATVATECGGARVTRPRPTW